MLNYFFIFKFDPPRDRGTFCAKRVLCVRDSGRCILVVRLLYSLFFDIADHHFWKDLSFIGKPDPSYPHWTCKRHHVWNPELPFVHRLRAALIYLYALKGDELWLGYEKWKN